MPSIRQAAEAALGGVRSPTLLNCAVASLTTTGADPLRRVAPTSSTSTATTSTTASTSTTSARTTTAAASSASTAATSAPTPATTPTATPTPSAASTAASTSSSSAPAPLALACATSSARGRRRADRLRTNEVGRNSRGNRGQEGGGGAPLKDGGARVTTRGSYSDNTLFCC
ncbi:unnamed protein product [Closterium sp. NIES-54]